MGTIGPACGFLVGAPCLREAASIDVGFGVSAPGDRQKRWIGVRTILRPLQERLGQGQSARRIAQHESRHAVSEEPSGARIELTRRRVEPRKELLFGSVPEIDARVHPGSCFYSSEPETVGRGPI